MAHSLPRSHLPRLGRRVPGLTRRVARQPPALSAEGEWPEGGLGSIPGRVS